MMSNYQKLDDFDIYWQTNKSRNSRGLVNFDNHWQFFVIICGWIGSNKKVLTNNEKKIINFEANFFDETSFSGFLGQKLFISTVKQKILGLPETLSYENYQK